MHRRYSIALALVATFAAAQEHHIPEQPIAFSHKIHTALNLKCRDCHGDPKPTLPAASKCMTCHSSIATEKPEIQKLKNYADHNEPIPWAPVYEIPDDVKFSHQRHAMAGFKCSKCHGPVETRDALWRETDIRMGGCLSCHRQNKARTNCRACHQDRQ